MRSEFSEIFATKALTIPEVDLYAAPFLLLENDRDDIPACACPTGSAAQVKGQIILSTSAPTEMQVRAARDAREDLAKVIDDTNAIISTVMPGLYRTLAENNLQPPLLKPLRTITSSGIR